MKNHFQAKYVLFFVTLLFMIVGGFYPNSTPTKVEAGCWVCEDGFCQTQWPPAPTPIENGMCYQNCNTTIAPRCQCNVGYHFEPSPPGTRFLDPSNGDNPRCVRDTSDVMSGNIYPAGQPAADQVTCIIGRDAGSCPQTLAWTTTNPIATSVVTNASGTTLATGNTGSQSFSIPHSTSANPNLLFILKNNGVELDTVEVAARCNTPVDIWDTSIGKCVEVTNMTGTLTATNCTITLGNSSCPTSLTWNTTNPGTNISAVTSAVNNSGANSPNFQVANGNSGTNVSAPVVPYPNRTFYLYNNGQELKRATATATCEIGTIWSGSKCVVDTGVSGTLTVSNCIILEGASSCDSSLTWNTTNPGTNISAVTSAVNNSGASSPNFQVANGNSGTNVSAPVVPYPNRTFYLYNNGQELKRATATAVCATSPRRTAWNGSRCVASPITVTLWATPGSLTLPANSTILNWSTTGTPNDCFATPNGDWTGDKAVGGGATSISDLTEGTHTYNISCSKTTTVGEEDRTITVESTVIVTVNPEGADDADARCGSVQYTCLSPTATYSNPKSFPTVRTWTCTSGNGNVVNPNCSVRSGSPGFIEN